MCSLAQFNQQVLQCQDDAYTLAWYLLGDEAAADTVTQAAVKTAYHLLPSNRQCCRLLVFEQVVRLCSRQNAKRVPLQNDELCSVLQSLPELERQAVILIDIMNLEYQDAAVILNQSVKEVAHWLAQARTKLMQENVEQRKELAWS